MASVQQIFALRQGKRMERGGEGAKGREGEEGLAPREKNEKSSPVNIFDEIRTDCALFENLHFARMITSKRK